MTVEALTVSESDEVSVSKGFYISKKLLIVIVCVFAAILVALIVGLTVGLKNQYTKDCGVISETQKLETCLNTGCKNTTFLESKKNFKSKLFFYFIVTFAHSSN